MFNNNSRTKNVLKTSSVGVCCEVLNIILGFVYRTIFIYVLSAAYLGINGLFSNIFQILSFAELGIGSVICYRLYQPISLDDRKKVSQLMYFYKKVYLIISLIIFALGLMLLPFLTLFIKDTSQIPSDVDLQITYILFLFQTISTYICISPQTLLSADQRQHILSLTNTISIILKYILQIIVLFISRDFTMTLVVGIVITLLSNIMISMWVKMQYKEIFTGTETISKTEKKEIFSETCAMMCHKVGGTILNSTDNIVLSSFVGIVSTGLYSNYALIVSSLRVLLARLFSGFTSSLGNAHFTMNSEAKYTAFKRLLYANFWIAGMCTFCLANLISDFITIWIGKDMLLDRITLYAICLQFYLEAIRMVATSYTFGSGLFSRDKLRPLIEAVLNVAISIVLVLSEGIAGVFLGTVISHVLTVMWREPYLLYKYEFKKSMMEYWILFAVFTMLTLGLSIIFDVMKTMIGISCGNLLFWIAEAIVCILFYNSIMVVVFRKNDSLRFYLNLLKDHLLKRKVSSE